MRGGRMRRWSVGLSVLLVCVATLAHAQDGGKAQVEGAAGSLILENHLIAARCSASDERGLHVEIKDVLENRGVKLDGPLSLLFGDGSIVRGDEMRIVERLKAEDLKPAPDAPRAAEHFGGKELHAVLEDERSGIRLRW